MQVVFLGNYVFWAWNLELKDSHFWIPDTQQEQTEAHCAAKHSKAIFYVMRDTDSDTVCCVYDLYDVYNNASKAIPDVNF